MTRPLAPIPVPAPLASPAELAALAAENPGTTCGPRPPAPESATSPAAATWTPARTL